MGVLILVAGKIFLSKVIKVILKDTVSLVSRENTLLQSQLLELKKKFLRIKIHNGQFNYLISVVILSSGNFN